MKHSVIIISILLGMFLLTQVIGLAVVYSYSPETREIVDENGNSQNITSYNLPFGAEPPQESEPQTNLFSIIIAFIIVISIMLLLMKVRAEILLRSWFFIVVSIAMAITFNAPIQNIAYSSIIALIVAIPLAYLKVFKRKILLHNLTELAIYPGIAAIFVPLLNLTTLSVLLVLFSVYDMYAVWHAGFMQKMAKYQIKTLKVFSGFLVPYIGPKQRAMLKSKKARKNIKVNLAILGGGDVIFPILAAGVIMQKFSPLYGFIVSIGATLALAGLFYMSEKGKFYPALPFISVGCFLGIGVAYLLGVF